MSALRYFAIRTAFEALSVSPVPPLVRALSKCKGVIFTLHRVVPGAPADFSPNAILQVTPTFLRTAIRKTRAAGFDIVSMSEAVSRIEADAQCRPFAVFTFDDGYRDNLVHALPVLREEQCPFTLYVPTGLVDGVGQVWWQALEDMIASRNAVSVRMGGESAYFDTRTLSQKTETYNRLYAHLRRISEDERIAVMKELAWSCGLDLDAHCRDLIMDWPEIQQMASDPLCMIGAHTVYHLELAKLSQDRAQAEISNSLDVLNAQLGQRPEHFSYPIGSTIAASTREYELVKHLGLRSGVTTRPGGLFAGHRERLNALPRISLNGLFQQGRYMQVFLTGGLFPARP